METTGIDSIQREVFDRLSRRARPRRGSALRMAPMIDMIFLLLIFFLVTAKWRPQEDFLPFQLPAAQAQDAVLGRPEALEIHIFATQIGCRVQIGQLHTVQIDNETIDANLALLMDKIAESLRTQKRFAGDPVEIICGPEVKWEYLAKIYNLFFGAGLTDITFRMTE
ncbi:MAG: biopolymer transporter ExbD [Planctomycetes bacterium]|nr:biopolymer transporter ExbD [Planctomycetota bacterium]